MKKVIVFDSYKRIYDEDGVMIHDADCSETVAATDLSFEDACAEVGNIFAETKLLGEYTEIVSEPQNGVVEVQIDFPDKRCLHRVIYLKDV